jgi:hypothetical protein
MGRKKENRVQKTFRLAEQTPDRLAKLAVLLGFIYNGQPAVGELLDAIGMLAEKISDRGVDG